jgi:hypothetical protein
MSFRVPFRFRVNYVSENTSAQNAHQPPTDNTRTDADLLRARLLKCHRPPLLPPEKTERQEDGAVATKSGRVGKPSGAESARVISDAGTRHGGSGTSLESEKYSAQSGGSGRPREGKSASCRAEGTKTQDTRRIGSVPRGVAAVPPSRQGTGSRK